jgi:hypothetical protein
VLFVRSAVPLDWRPEWWRPHTHLPALTPLRAGRAIVGGTFTHPSPVAGLVYTGSAASRPITRLAEQRDGSLFGQPLATLDAETFGRRARQLGIGLVVALDQDARSARFLEEDRVVREHSRIGPFTIFTVPDAPPEPVPLGPQRWRVTVPAPAAGWQELTVAYSPLWTARSADGPLPTRRSADGLLEVRLPGPVPALVLEHRAGLAEWAGVAVSAGALLGLGAWWWRRSRA